MERLEFKLNSPAAPILELLRIGVVASSLGMNIRGIFMRVRLTMPGISFNRCFPLKASAASGMACPQMVLSHLDGVPTFACASPNRDIHSVHAKEFNYSEPRKRLSGNIFDEYTEFSHDNHPPMMSVLVRAGRKLMLPAGLLHFTTFLSERSVILCPL